MAAYGLWPGVSPRRCLVRSPAECRWCWRSTPAWAGRSAPSSSRSSRRRHGWRASMGLSCASSTISTWVTSYSRRASSRWSSSPSRFPCSGDACIAGCASWPAPGRTLGALRPGSKLVKVVSHEPDRELAVTPLDGFVELPVDAVSHLGHVRLARVKGVERFLEQHTGRQKHGQQRRVVSAPDQCSVEVDALAGGAALAGKLLQSTTHRGEVVV